MPVLLSIGVWVWRAVGVYTAVQEANDVVQDVTSTKPLMNPTSWYGQLVKKSSEIEMNREMKNRALPRFQM